MAQYGGEQYMKQEGYETNEQAQNQLHSTAGHDIGGTGTNVHSTMSTGHDFGGMGTNVNSTMRTGQDVGDIGTNVHSTMSTGQDVGGMGTNVYSTTTGQDIGGTGANMGMGGGHSYEEGKQEVVEQMKEKFSGGDYGSNEHTTNATATGGGEYGNVGEEGYEKKGLMDKIKDKLPGVGNQ